MDSWPLHGGKRVQSRRSSQRYLNSLSRSPHESLFSADFFPPIDKKCPFTGNVSIRGRILTGVVKSTKMNRTIIIRRDYLHFIPKYRRYEKRHKNLAVHCSPAFRVEVGDQVTVGQCRPLSKTVRFNVLRVLPNLRVSPCRPQAIAES